MAEKGFRSEKRYGSPSCGPSGADLMHGAPPHERSGVRFQAPHETGHAGVTQSSGGGAQWHVHEVRHEWEHNRDF
jgi:hypothetical protein